MQLINFVLVINFHLKCFPVQSDYAIVWLFSIQPAAALRQQALIDLATTTKSWQFLLAPALIGLEQVMMLSKW